MGAAELSFVVKAIDQASGTLNNVNGQIDGMGGSFSILGWIDWCLLVPGIGVSTSRRAVFNYPQIGRAWCRERG